MHYTTLGKTGVTVSKLCFGTMSFGKEADEQTSAKLFGRCREKGINFFDCANVYSGGVAEEILGKLIASERDQLIITSKVGMPKGGDRPNGRGLSRRHIHMEINGSLKRLKTDWIDVYFCHCDDTSVPLPEMLRAMDDLVRAGKIRYVGLSNWSAWRTVKALGVAEREGLSMPAVLQPMYSLAKRTAEVEILPMAEAEKLGVISYSPLGGGLLTGKYVAGDEKAGRLAVNAMYSQRYQAETYHEIAGRFAEHAKMAGVHPATLAVAWVMTNPAITAPIIGARNLEQLEPSLAAADYELTPDDREEISGLTPPVPIATDRDEEKQ